MPKEFSRTRRVGEQIKRLLAELIRDSVKDPRVGMVTLTDIEVSRDYAYAKVYFSVLGDEATQATSLKALNNAAGFLQREVGREIKIRHIPRLQFLLDTSIEKGFYMDQLIAKAIESDQSKN